jgi:hypothetical protein
VDERQPKGKAEMLGETLREAAVLFLVFLPLDVAFGLAEDLLSLSGNEISVIVVGSIVGSVLLE